MFCKFCGSEIENDANFCPNCGKVVTNDLYSNSIEKEEPVISVYETVVDEEKQKAGGKILKSAILGAAFASTAWFALVGLIFSIISRVRLNKYISVYGETEGRATAGKIVGKVALILSIVLTAFMTLYFALLILAVVGTNTSIEIFENMYDSGIYF